MLHFSLCLKIAPNLEITNLTLLCKLAAICESAISKKTLIFLSYFVECQNGNYPEDNITWSTRRLQNESKIFLAVLVYIEENGQLFLKKCFGMLMPSSV